jgi:acyl-homoserine lactone acylase PvdQ
VLPLLLLLAVSAAAETVEIIHDAYGAPHIFAPTAAGAAFGAGYAQAEDRPEALLKNLALTEEAAALKPEVQVLVDAYVAGVNRAFGEQRVTSAQVVAFSRRAYNSIRGSNDFFLPPSRTSSKSVMAILNPIADWDALYEMSLYAGDLSLAGVAPVGMPFPIVGHSEHVAIGWSGDPATAGPKAIEEAWSLITARSMADIRSALAGNQIPGRLSCGTAAGELCEQVPHPVVQEIVRVQQTWSFANVESLALNTEVYKAETWQRLLARLVPDSRFARVITGWNRRADADSRPALAFYLFKMALARDASLLEPSDSLSVPRILAALMRAQDRLETELDFNSTWGTFFRIARDGSRESFPAAGGTLPEAGITTPRTLHYVNNRANAGQAATRVVELSRTPNAKSILPPGMAKLKQTYFQNRRELERAASSIKKIETISAP